MPLYRLRMPSSLNVRPHESFSLFREKTVKELASCVQWPCPNVNENLPWDEIGGHLRQRERGRAFRKAFIKIHAKSKRFKAYIKIWLMSLTKSRGITDIIIIMYRQDMAQGKQADFCTIAKWECTIVNRVYIYNYTSMISIILYSKRMVYCIAAAVQGGGTVIVRVYAGPEDRFNPYNQWILIHQCLYHSRKHNK